MTTINDMNVFPEELTRLEEWEDYISEFEEWEHGPLWGYIDETVLLRDVSIDDLPSVEDFRDAYRGEWDSFEDYAANLVEECGYFGDCSDFLRTYFDYEKFSRDLEFDYCTHDAPGLKVWVYSAI